MVVSLCAQKLMGAAHMQPTIFASPLAGEVGGYGNLRTTQVGEGFARMRALVNG